MDAETIAAKVDHTVLGPTTTPAAVDRVLDEAKNYRMNVCIPSCYLDRASGFPNLVATVIGFPHGQEQPTTKRQAAQDAVAAGADELDVVCNVGRLIAGETDTVRDELEAITAAVDVPVKVIVEAPLLDDEQLDRACRLAAEADAAMVKTATGFSEGGATVADVERMAAQLPVKASGGIGTYEKAMSMLDAGAVRIGASSGTAIVDGAPD